VRITGKAFPAIAALATCGALTVAAAPQASATVKHCTSAPDYLIAGTKNIWAGGCRSAASHF
jgi:hypothetical protein